MSAPAIAYQQIPLASVRIDGGTQPRAAIDEDLVAEYAAAFTEGAVFPPVTVFYDGAAFWLADGFHRYHAASRASHTEIAADVRTGTRRDAVLWSVGANATHGLRRTNEDKRRAVLTLLQDGEWCTWSDREIARRCAVDNTTVSRLRPSVGLQQIESNRTVLRNGTVYTMDTSNIGQSPAEDDPADDVPFDGDDDTEEFTPEQQYAYDREQADAAHAAGFYVRWPQIEDYLPVEDVPDPDVPDHAAHTRQVMGSSESHEWYTPVRVLEYVYQLLGDIDLDPCSNSHESPNVAAGTRYTLADDGLAHEWHGRVFMNPPYGDVIPAWTEKLVASFVAGTVTEAVTLIPARVDTLWFAPLYHYPICLMRGRVTFVGSATPAPFPSAIVYMGPHEDRFLEIFAALGPIVRRIA